MIVGNQKMVQLRFGQCGVPVVCGILGPIGVDGHRPDHEGTLRQVKSPNCREPGVIRCICPIAADYSPFIDSLFDGSPIKNCPSEPIS
jgi:hypothetical protein